MDERANKLARAALSMPNPNAARPVGQEREHITDGTPCWCNPYRITTAMLEAEAVQVEQPYKLPESWYGKAVTGITPKGERIEYTAEQMHAACEAVREATPQPTVQVEPVGEITGDGFSMLYGHKPALRAGTKLYATPQQAAPDSKLVPIEPTGEQLDALTDRMWKDHTAWTVYRAMVKAAPKATP